MVEKEEVGDSSTAGTSRTCSNGGSGENECSHDESIITVEIGFVPWYDLYTMDINRGRNCYNCEGFEYITRYCRKQENQRRIGWERRVNYENNRNTSNLNGEENLIVLD